MGRLAHLDVTLASGFHGWMPAQHPAVHIHAEGYRTYSLQLRGRVAGLFTLHQLTFETDGASSPRAGGPAAAPLLQPGLPGAARALAVFGIPVLRAGASGWLEPVIRYEASRFATTALPSRPVCLVGRDADTDADPPACTMTSGPLRMASRFESLVLGVGLADWVSSGSLYAGLDLTAQRKPYQVNVDGRALDDYLFDARFRGLGFAGGLGLGGEQGPRVDVGLRFGAARVSLTDDLSLEDVLPEGWALSYLRWQAEAGWGQVIWQGSPVVLLRASLAAGGSHFYYTRKDTEEDVPLNRDLFLSGNLALVLMM